MCEFCHKHGEGKKWYLEAKNYSEDLLSDLRRRNFIADFFSKPVDLTENVGKLEKLSREPSFVRNVLTPYISGRQKKVHFGQVLPMEDVERTFGFVSSIVRVECICRQCMRVCQFGAIGYSAANKKVVIDPRRCYGYGVCRASCTKVAITLHDRTSVPAAASI